MVGRQNLYVNPNEIRALLAPCGIIISQADAREICASGYAETLLRFLGAESTCSFDYSDYQSSTHIHDMNEPIGNDFKEAYSAVLDGGSLEHIFNFPVAIKNCMEMVKVGGHYLAITPANNFFGHGFYQFSPELYFTVLSKANGFEVTKMIAFEEKTEPVWYAVRSPREAAERVTLSNSLPVYLLIIAKRLARLPIFECTPQQSDYVALWAAKHAEKPVADSRSNEIGRRPLSIRVAKTFLPVSVRTWLRGVFERPAPKLQGFDPRFFERMDWPA